MGGACYLILGNPGAGKLWRRETLARKTLAPGNLGTGKPWRQETLAPGHLGAEKLPEPTRLSEAKTMPR